MLIHFGELCAQFLIFHAEQVNHHDAPRPRSEVSPVSVVADVLFECGALAETKMRSLLPSDDKTRAMKFDPRRADALVRDQWRRTGDIHTNGQVRIDWANAFRKFNCGGIGI